MRTTKNRGGALLTALFIMTLVAIVATAMTTRLQLDIYRTRLILTHDKLYLASQAVSFWALGELSNPQIQYTTQDKTGMVSHFPKNMVSIYPQVQITGGIIDMQNRYNLNNLSNKAAFPQFIALGKAMADKISDVDSKRLALALNDWLYPYDLGRGEDAYTSYYLAQKPPYYPSHQLMQSFSELRLVKDVQANTFLALEPYTTVLPEITPININTASKQVLLSLGNGLNEQRLTELISARGDKGIKDINQVNNILKKSNISSDNITIESQFYLSVAYVKSDDFNLTVYTLIKRVKSKQNKIAVSIVRESINTF